MEAAIEKLSERLESDSAWSDAIERLDENLNRISQGSAGQITAYFAHEENPTPRAMDLAWVSLELQTLHFFRELDSSGVSEIVGNVAPDYLRGFVYREASQFRAKEEDQLKALEIPPAAWELFWDLIDQHKEEFISEMGEYRPYSFYRHLSPRIEKQIHNPPMEFRHLSPFKWGRATAAGIAAVLGIADTLGGVLTLPFGGAIAVASILGTGVAVGYLEGAK